MPTTATCTCSPGQQRVIGSLTRFLDRRLRLEVNAAKRAVDRPWNGKLLGYSMTFPQAPHLQVTSASVDRLNAKLRETVRTGRGRNPVRLGTELAPVLRGGVNYFRPAEVKGVFEALDGWIRR